MNRYIINSLWDRNNRNGLNNNFIYLFDSVNRISNIDARLSVSINKLDGLSSDVSNLKNLNVKTERLLSEAKNINEENVNVQKQVDDLILSAGESDAEVINARGDYPLLRERLENTDDSVGMINDFVGTGLIDVNKMHPDFPLDIPFNVWLNRDGTFGNDFDKESFKSGATQFYFDWENGDDSNDGLSESTALRTLSNLIDAANAHSSNKININIMNIHIPFNFHGYPNNNTYQISTGKTVIFSPYNRDKFYLSSFQRNDHLEWVKDGNAYKASRSVTAEVFDLSKLGYRDLPKRLKKVTSITAVKNERGTWYTNGTDIWIRLDDDRTPDEYIGVMVNNSAKVFNLAVGAKLMFDNAGFYAQATSLGNINNIRVEGTAGTELYLINPEIGFSSLNGLSTYDVDKVWVFNPKAYENYKDGLNYHGSSTNKIFEFMGEQWNNGKDEAGNNNGSTAHSGMSTVRFGTLAYSNDGPQIADVGDCYSIMFNSEGHSSTKLTKSNTKAGIFIGGENPKAYLYNCGGGGADTYSLSGNSAAIHVRNFKGNDIYPAIKENITLI